MSGENAAREPALRRSLTPHRDRVMTAQSWAERQTMLQVKVASVKLWPLGLSIPVSLCCHPRNLNTCSLDVGHMYSRLKCAWMVFNKLAGMLRLLPLWEMRKCNRIWSGCEKREGSWWMKDGFDKPPRGFRLILLLIAPPHIIKTYLIAQMSNRSQYHLTPSTPRFLCPHCPFVPHLLTWTDTLNSTCVYQYHVLFLFFFSSRNTNHTVTAKCKAHHLFLKWWQKEECTSLLRRETWSILLIAELRTKPSSPWKVPPPHTHTRYRLVPGLANPPPMGKGRIQCGHSNSLWLMSWKSSLKLFCTIPPRQAEVIRQQLLLNFGGWDLNDIPVAQGTSLSKLFLKLHGSVLYR